MRRRLNMVEVAPGAYPVVLGLEKYCVKNVDSTVLELIKLRASVINGCAYCVDMHSHDALSKGETTERLFQVAAWHDAACFTDRERAALALTDQVTRIADGGVSDEVWAEVRAHWSEEETANLIMAIATINVWNRMNVATRNPPERRG